MITCCVRVWDATNAERTLQAELVEDAGLRLHAAGDAHHRHDQHRRDVAHLRGHRARNTRRPGGS